MTKLFRGVVLCCLALQCFAQTRIVDMKTLVGKKAVVQRMPLYVPGTYQAIPNSYAGKTVTIIDVKSSSIYSALPKLTASQMASLPQESRENIENVRSASIVVVQFEDGTKADTGAIPVMPTMLSSYLDVISDPTAPSSVVSNNHPNTEEVHRTIAPNQTCPVEVTKATSSDGGFSHALVDGLTKSEFERAVERADAGGNDPHYLDVRMRNASRKSVRAIEAFAIYTDAMGDPGPQTTLVTQNTKDIKPGGEYRAYAVDTAQRSENGLGDVTVFVNRIRYEDNSFWQDNGSHSCSLTNRIK